jgi:hypothetical protein
MDTAADCGERFREVDCADQAKGWIQTAVDGSNPPLYPALLSGPTATRWNTPPPAPKRAPVY